MSSGLTHPILKLSGIELGPWHSTALPKGVSMRAWIEADDAGRQFLSRAGEGVVVSVSPVGIAGPDGGYLFHLIALDCDHGPSGVRVRVRAQIATEDPLYAIGCSAFDDGRPMVWSVQWHRHDWVPGHLPIVALDLATDARGRLVELRPADVDAGAPDFVPASWERLQS